MLPAWKSLQGKSIGHDQRKPWTTLKALGSSLLFRMHQDIGRVVEYSKEGRVTSLGVLATISGPPKRLLGS